jgi:PEP-CTERM motif
MKSLIRGVLAGCVLAASVSSVSADPLQFNNVGPGGLIAFGTTAGTNAEITAAPIRIVSDLDDSALPLLISGTCGTLANSGCLDVETGDFISFTPTLSLVDDPHAGIYTYGEGGSVEIVGDDGVGVIGPTVLLDASFATPVTIAVSGGNPLPGGGFGQLSAALSGALAFGGAIDPALAAYFGSNPLVSSGNDSQNVFLLTFFPSPTGDVGAGTITQSTVEVNTFARPVPEPASMTLLGMMSLFGLAAFRRTAV